MYIRVRQGKTVYERNHTRKQQTRDCTPTFYWPQVEAHYKKKVTIADGSEYYTWMGLREDHCGDCEAMQIVVASIMGLTGAESMAPAEVKAEAVNLGALLPVHILG